MKEIAATKVDEMNRQGRADDAGSTFTVVTTGVAAIILVAVLTIPTILQDQWQRREIVLQTREQRDAAATRLDMIARNVRNYYDRDHLYDSADLHWRIAQLSSDMRRTRSENAPFIGAIQYQIAPTPARGLVQPTDQRLLFSYQANQWVLTGVKMRLQCLEAFGCGRWREIPYDEEDLRQISAEKLKIAHLHGAAS